MMVKILLDGQWKLSCYQKSIKNIPMNIPGDIHSSLLRQNIIEDPYFDCNEKKAEWVHYNEWTIHRSFEMKNIEKYSQINLVLKQVDTYATFSINNKKVIETSNMFRIYKINVKGYLKNGKNKITIDFHSAPKKAEELSKILPYEVPWSEGNTQIPFMNLVRKAQFHSGWDWGPYLIPSGIYDSVELHCIEKYEINNAKIKEMTITKNNAHVVFEISYNIYKNEDKNQKIVVSFADQEQIIELNSEQEKDRVFVSFDVKDPILWYAHDYGQPYLYNLFVYDAEDQKNPENALLHKKIGLRDLKLKLEKDKLGTTFTFVLNGIEIFAKGANFIPFDALPERMTKERTLELLNDAKEANMNMLRIWGGGFFLNDYFYEICDELGILLWHDMMFACAQYPTTDWFLNEVKEELHSQINRLQYHPCIALWCGDNECWNSITWYNVSKAKPEFYAEEHAKLNRLLKKTINELDETRVFWLASPSRGLESNYIKDFDDKQLLNGDSHFWEVWHGKLTFEGFLHVTPRFCSEFGFQSYPSYPVVQTFTPEGTNSLQHPAFDAHQKNKMGNKKIFEMFSTYFHEPTDFKYTLYLSQVQQSLAIKTGVERWRQIKHICSGTLFWQLNDCWPVSSWSSVEYGGRWKQLMYHAMHFYEPQTLSFEDAPQQIKLYFINDKQENVNVRFRVRWYDWEGKMTYGRTGNAEIPANQAIVIWEQNKWQMALPKDQGFIYATTEINGKEISNFFFTDVYKNCSLPEPNISVRIERKENMTMITLSTDKPAFFVHLEAKQVRKFSDSSFVLLPEHPKTVFCIEPIEEKDLTIYHLK